MSSSDALSQNLAKDKQFVKILRSLPVPETLQEIYRYKKNRNYDDDSQIISKKALLCLAILYGHGHDRSKAAVLYDLFDFESKES